MTFILLILFGVLFLLFLLMHDEARMERERSFDRDHQQRKRLGR